MQITFPGVIGSGEIAMDCVVAILGETPRQSFIDLGCDLAPMTTKFEFKKRRYVDILPKTLVEMEEQEYFVQMDALDLPRDEKYSVAFSLDNIEHFTKEKGYELLSLMETISDKQILFTPLGGMWVGTSGHPEEHQSGWYPEDVPGYAALVFPQYHLSWNFGAWYFWKCENIEQDFERVCKELKNKSWIR